MTNRVAALNAKSPFFHFVFPYLLFLHIFPPARDEYSQILTKSLVLYLHTSVLLIFNSTHHILLIDKNIYFPIKMICSNHHTIQSGFRFLFTSQ